MLHTGKFVARLLFHFSKCRLMNVFTGHYSSTGKLKHLILKNFSILPNEKDVTRGHLEYDDTCRGDTDILKP